VSGGSFIGAVAKVGMPIMAGYKLKVAARLNSRALRVRRDRIDQERLFVDRLDHRPGGDAIVQRVVAG